jgi:uncharacterized OB-fold protein
MTAIALAPPDELFQLDTDPWTAPYWDAARKHQLVAPKCGACGTFRMPPQPFCPHCNSQALEWERLSGRGVIYSFTIVNVAIIPAMRDHVPYVPAVVTLPDAGGIRIISNIVGCPVEAVRIDTELEVCWHHRDDGVVVPRFRLAGSDAG